MLKKGDVVLGAFVTTSGKTLQHYSVVLDANPEAVMLVYTTSLKEHSDCAQRFTSEDMRLAGWTTSCRYDASQVCVVPAAQVRRTGRISQHTFDAIVRAHALARRSRSVQCAMLTPKGEVVCA